MGLAFAVQPACAQSSATIYPDHILKKTDQDKYEVARPLKTGGDGLQVRQVSGYLYLALVDYDIADERFKKAKSTGDVTIAREANTSCKSNLDEAEKLQALLGDYEKKSGLAKKLTDAINSTRKKQESLKTEIFKKEFPNTDPKIAGQIEKLQEDFTREKLRTRDKEIDSNRRLLNLTSVYGDVYDAIIDLRTRTNGLETRVDDLTKVVNELRPNTTATTTVQPECIIEYASPPRHRIFFRR